MRAQENVATIPAPGAGRDEVATLEDTQRAVLNILDDFSTEKTRLEDTQQAVLNILDDFGAEKARLESTQQAVLNILDDFGAEKARLEDTQQAVLNILDDFGTERAHLESTQQAVLNILDDFSTEKAHLESTQQAVFNILEDLNAEKSKLEDASTSLQREITERRKAATQLEASNKELEAFAYSVSHDLRAPLRSIDGFSQAILEDYLDKLDEQGRDYLRRVRAASQHMAQLIDNLLTLSRVTRGEMRLETVHLTALAREIAEELRRTKPDREATFLIAEGLVARGDPVLLHQVLQNLLENAWKFTSSHPRARIEFGEIERDGRTAYFVRDDGVGFNMEYVNKLFAPFQRLHSSTEFPGTGIGLAIVQRIVHRHGGRVWAEGAMDQGAAIYFTLE